MHDPNHGCACGGGACGHHPQELPHQPPKPHEHAGTEHAHHEHRCHHVEVIHKLKQERDEHLAGWQRSQADYQNLKKDVEKQRQGFMIFANEGLILELLPIVDFFKFAFEHRPPKEVQTTDWFLGIQHIRDELNKVLEHHGVKQIPTEGAIFDPQRHEAVEEEASDQPSGTILNELATGFTLNGKLLRPAKVKIAK